MSGNYFALQQEKPSDNSDKLKAWGYVMVTPGGPEDGGDFGPETTNAKNSRIQESFDCIKEIKRCLHRWRRNH